MGQLRNILRAQLFGNETIRPPDVVARLDRAMRDLHIDTIATLILANVEPPRAAQTDSVATLRWSNAGHPAPVLIHADGTAIHLDVTTDLLLGFAPTAMARPLPPDSPWRHRAALHRRPGRDPHRQHRCRSTATARQRPHTPPPRPRRPARCRPRRHGRRATWRRRRDARLAGPESVDPTHAIASITNDPCPKATRGSWPQCTARGLK